MRWLLTHPTWYTSMYSGTWVHIPTQLSFGCPNTPPQQTHHLLSTHSCGNPPPQVMEHGRKTELTYLDIYPNTHSRNCPHFHDIHLYILWIDHKIWLAFSINAGDPGLTPGSGRSPGKGNGNPLQYCSLENPMDRGSWYATVYGSQRVEHDWATSLHFTGYNTPATWV